MIERKQVPFTFGPDRDRAACPHDARPLGAVRPEVLLVAALVWFGREFTAACERIGESSWFVVCGIAVALCICFARAQGWLT